jgi:hypothetical protein
MLVFFYSLSARMSNRLGTIGERNACGRITLRSYNRCVIRLCGSDAFLLDRANIKWAANQEKFQPQGDIFFLDFSLCRTYQELRKIVETCWVAPISAFTEEAGCQNLC